MWFRKRNQTVTGVELSELIDYVTSQLREAHERATAHETVMQFNECDIEVAVTVERHSDLGVKVYVLDVGGKISKTQTNTIQVRFNSIPASTVGALENTGMMFSRTLWDWYKDRTTPDTPGDDARAEHEREDPEADSLPDATP